MLGDVVRPNGARKVEEVPVQERDDVGEPPQGAAVRGRAALGVGAVDVAAGAER